MKVVILCGGLGSRLSEETVLKPKPMVEVGGIPILVHIMNIYSYYGYNHFVLALGYKSHYIKEYFSNFTLRNSDLNIDLKKNKISYLRSKSKNWKIDLIETGNDSMTGGRLLRLKNQINDDNFMLTYGDGVSDIDINKLLDFHKSHNKIATITSVRPIARFGSIGFNDKMEVLNFKEKPQSDQGWINGGFFVFNKKVFNYLSSDETILEREPLENLVRDKNLLTYNHSGFWQCMDTVRDRDFLNELYVSNKSPWIKK